MEYEFECWYRVSLCRSPWWRVRAILIGCCSVALSNVRGDGVFGMVVQTSFRISRHLGAMGRSKSGMVLMIRLSLSQWAGSVEAKSARRYARAASSF